MSQMKTCPKCQTLKDPSEFSARSGTVDGRQIYCRICQKTAKQRWQERMTLKHTSDLGRPEIKKCQSCRQVLAGPAFNQNKATSDGLDARCRACMAAKHLALKKKFVAGYGGKCTCCGESRIEFLTMEHRNKDGAAHRAARDVQGAWRDAIAAGFPSIYTVLCYNCNQAETHGRICPHKTEKLATENGKLPIVSDLWQPLWACGVM